MRTGGCGWRRKEQLRSFPSFAAFCLLTHWVSSSVPLPQPQSLLCLYTVTLSGLRTDITQAVTIDSSAYSVFPKIFSGWRKWMFRPHRIILIEWERWERTLPRCNPVTPPELGRWSVLQPPQMLIVIQGRQTPVSYLACLTLPKQKPRVLNSCHCMLCQWQRQMIHRTQGAASTCRTAR